MELKLVCKVITPMFMAGADYRTAELRSSEFKGMMRWWWRAIRAENNIESLKREEAKIFGGTGEGEGRSKVSVRVIYNEAQMNLYIGDSVRSPLKDKYAGVAYLLYSTILPNRERSFIKDGFEFEIVLQSFDEVAFYNGVASLWAAIYLGGFGTRARRGGGNLSIESAQPDNIEGLNFYCNSADVNELSLWLENNIKIVKRLCNANGGSSKYTTLRGANILLFKPLRSWQSALNFIGEKFRDFRNENRERIFETPAFGMPVMHNRSDIRLVPYEDTRKRLSDRWASPVIFKVIKGKGENYFPIVIFLSPGGIRFIGSERKVSNNWRMEEVQGINFEILSSFKKDLNHIRDLLI